MIPSGVVVTHPDRLFIGGAWVPAQSGRWIEVISPDTEQVVARVAEADAADMDSAVRAARRAFDEGPWPWLPPAERIAAFRRLIDHLRPRCDQLAAAWTAQVGGLAAFAGPMHAGALAALDQIADLADAFPFTEVRGSPAAAAAILAREPVGVVAAIAPWNGPFGIMANKLAYALCTGCTVILKPSPETPLEAYLLAEAAEAADLPPGVVNLVPAHREASDHLVCHPGIDKVSFTGSTAAGRRIASVVGERIGRCTLELGGKSAAILRDDFAIEDAARILTGAITLMCGQVCAALSRVIVPKPRHDALARAIADIMAQVVIGPSTSHDTQLGPVAMKRQLERIEGYIAEGRTTAELVTGGRRPGHLSTGFFIEPTLFAGVNNRSRIAQEEIFGPVLCLIPCDDDADAIRIANESHYGLNGSVLTHDADAAYQIARRVRTGAVGQNGLRMDFGLPYGGFKQSGIGREGGAEGLAGCTELKTILLDGMPAQL